MNRLTKKGTRMVNDFREADWYNKLSNLEDLEDELGCPLDVVFKALKDGIYYANNSFTTVILRYCEPLKELYFDTIYTGVYFNLNDYKKTWCLKEDLSE